MYEAFFGFSRRPFSLTPDPDFLFWTEQHRRAFDLVCMSLMRHAPISLITGEVGSGKTTLVQELMREVAGDLEVALLSNVVGDSGDLLRWILTAFDRDALSSTRAEALREVEALLREIWAEGRRSVLIVDEAQNVSDHGIETLRLLTNLDVGKAAPLSLVLVGQPQLRDRLGGDSFVAFRQRLGAAAHLGPMNLDETRGYVRNRVEIAGGDPDLFDAGAVEAVHRRAMGLPRLTNLLCDVCLVSAFGEDRRRVDGVFAESALAESLAISGLGGLAAEAAGAAEPQKRIAGMGQGAVSTLGRASARRTEHEVPPASKRRKAPSLRVVDGGAEGAAATGPMMLEQPRDSPLRLGGPAPSRRADRGATPARERSQRPAPTPGRRARRVAVWRRALGSVAGAAVAVAVAAVTLILPATGTDGGETVTLAVADVTPAASIARGKPQGTAPAAPRASGPTPREVPRAAPDPVGAEEMFRRALDQAATDSAGAAVSYARAAARGHLRAAYYLAQLYETGDGVTLAPDTAWAWYGVAAERFDAAEARLAELAAVPGPGTGFAHPRFAAREAGLVELVWDGRGTYVVELASTPDGQTDAIHPTPLTAVRLKAADAEWWRVRAVGMEPSAWQRIEAEQVATVRPGQDQDP